jgi:colanic acid biosynthesis glycosyl transferase WcaI
MTGSNSTNKRLKVLFLTAYYPPEVGAAQTRTHELSLRLSNTGYDVSVLTAFPSYPSGIVPKEWRGKFFWKGSEEGLDIFRVWSFTAPGGKFITRLLNNLTFAFFATLVGLWLSRPDVIVVESHPLFNGIAAIALSALKRVPFILNVSDLWPESAVQIGALKNPTLIWMGEKLEQLLYRRAATILAMTGGIWNKIRHDGYASKVLLFRNAVDCDFFRPGVDGVAMRSQLGIAPDAFMVLYAGTFGMFNDTKSILETAARFKNEGNHRVQFVFAGDGNERRKLQDFATENGLSNVRFVGSFPKATIPALLGASDCVVIALKNLEFLNGTLPRKMFEAMSCAKPVVLAAAGEAEEVVKQAEGGIVVPPEDTARIHDAVMTLVTHPEEAIAMGQNGRRYVQEHFSQDKRAKELSGQLQLLSWSPGGVTKPR